MPNLINYHGGPQLRYMSPMALFASIAWPDGSTAAWSSAGADGVFRCEIDTFFHDFLASTYWNALTQYLAVPNSYVSPGPYAPGPYAGTTGLSVLAQTSQPGAVSDGAIQQSLESSIQGGLLPYTTSPTCYCVLVPPDVVVIDATGARSDDPNHGFGGYHGVFDGAKVGPIYYSIIVGISDIDELTY